MAHFIVPKLACCRQAQLSHSIAVACYCMWIALGNLAHFMVPKLVLLSAGQALSLHRCDMLSHTVALSNLAHIIVPKVVCCKRAQFFHSIAVACYRIRLHLATWHLS
jgi:hypothetical protein